jgi:hypothetical protein
MDEAHAVMDGVIIGITLIWVKQRPETEGSMKTNYAEFKDSLKTNENGVVSFFGQFLNSKEDVVDYVKTFPQISNAVDNYKEIFQGYKDKGAPMWDMALLLWLSALKHGDIEYADEIRAYALGHGVKLSKFPGNVFMRTP